MHIGGLEVQACTGKEQYETLGLAQKVAKRRSRNGNRFSIYRCPYCHKYHIGSALREVERLGKRPK